MTRGAGNYGLGERKGRERVQVREIKGDRRAIKFRSRGFYRYLPLFLSREPETFLRAYKKINRSIARSLDFLRRKTLIVFDFRAPTLSKTA